MAFTPDYPAHYQGKSIYGFRILPHSFMSISNVYEALAGLVDGSFTAGIFTDGAIYLL